MIISNNQNINPQMGFEVEDYPFPVYTSLAYQSKSIAEIGHALNLCYQSRCDKLITPIFLDNYLHQISVPQNEQSNEQISLDNCLIPSDIYFKQGQYHHFIPQINSCIWSQTFNKQKRSQIIKLITGYSSFLNLKQIIMKIAFDGSQSDILLTDRIIECFSNIKAQLKRSLSKLLIIFDLDGSTGEKNGEVNEAIWSNYVQFRNRLDETFDHKLQFQVGLHFKGNLPDTYIINRWKSQGISYVCFDDECFIDNSKGYRILPAKHQRVMLQFANLKANITIQAPTLTHRIVESLKYIHYAFRKMTQNKLKSQKDAINLIDYLQDPLQPYADNLQSMTYEVFENDTIKYDEYQGALEDALEKFSKDKKVVIYYIGGGRGGLLFNAFAAAKKRQRKIFVYIIEKNPYPIQTMKQRIRQNKWQSHTKLIQTDIRDYEMPQHPDIFLSELLGGFGDNQLSPQCLCWAQKNIAQDTICIPTSYQSYIKPISYQAIHRSLPKQQRHCYYTVNFGMYYTNFPSKMVWEFKHPLQSKQQQFNKDSGFIEFEAKKNIVINGFAGYFTTHLYSYSQLSILPEKPTLGSYSWFPLYFPFQKEVLLKAGQLLKIQISRMHHQKQVWYEWQYQYNGDKSCVHNKDGWKIMIQL